MTATEQQQREITRLLEAKITEYSFEFEYSTLYGWLPHVVQRDSDYVSVSIMDSRRFDANDCAYIHRITARASVCQMNPNSNAAELYRAAEQIQRGARLIEAIDGMKLGFTEYFRRELTGQTLTNSVAALSRLLTGKFSFRELRHDGNFVFSARLEEGMMLTISTEPVDEEQAHIKITGICVY